MKHQLLGEFFQETLEFLTPPKLSDEMDMIAHIFIAMNFSAPLRSEIQKKSEDESFIFAPQKTPPTTSTGGTKHQMQGLLWSEWPHDLPLPFAQGAPMLGAGLSKKLELGRFHSFWIARRN